MNAIYEALERIEQHADAIFVRHHKDGEVTTVALSELPTAEALRWVTRWLRTSLSTSTLMPPEAFDDLNEMANDILPKIEGSHFVIGLMEAKIDALQCLQIGAALLFEKPLILLQLPGVWIPPRLRKLADTVVTGSLNDIETQDRMKAALKDLVRRLESKA